MGPIRATGRGIVAVLRAGHLRAPVSRRRIAMSAILQKKDFWEPPEGRTVRVALCQMTVAGDKQLNIKRASSFIREASAAGAQLVVLPEMWNCPYSNESFPEYAEDLEGGAAPSAQALANLARDFQITLVGGSIPERCKGRLYNTSLVFGPDGKLLGRHRKVHLFDIDIPGEISFRESDTLTAGEAGTVIDTPVGRLGVGICYDMRFPEMAMMYARRGCQILVYPAAFNMTTGPLHWELLQRARAVDNQVFVMSCSPARNNNASYVAWGHSMVVSPFGVVIANLNEEEAVLMCDINTEEVHTRRRNMPLMKQRRWDLYRLQASDLAFQPNRRPALSISPEPRTSGDKSPAPGAEAGVDGRERKDAGGVDSVNSQG